MVTVDGKSVPKPEKDWTDAEEQQLLGYSRALNVIYNGVDLNVFKLINYSIIVKDAWKSLEVVFEGTSKVKTFRKLLLTTKFESLKMMEEETITKYNVRVMEIANESFNLGEGISYSKLVRKVLRSLPRRFDMKVIVIEKAQDITTLSLDQLFGSLCTFEITL